MLDNTDFSSSYTSANGMPDKVLQDVELINSIVNNNKILLRHLQLCPTNKCNLNCKFCSCMDRDKQLELSYSTIENALSEAQACGCRATTITGGGEPLLHPEIDKIVEACVQRNIDVGLVTNGVCINRLPNGVKWCRVSFDSNRNFEDIEKELTRAVIAHPNVDWSFSYVLSAITPTLTSVVNFANSHKFSHIRIVSDIFNPDTKLINRARQYLSGIDELIIYQDRTNSTPGTKKCLISLLKPLLGADGKIYPCCGIQYATNNKIRDFVQDMGNNLYQLNTNQTYFNGSLCEVCYYSHYNTVLQSLTKTIKHSKWV